MWSRILTRPPLLACGAALAAGSCAAASRVATACEGRSPEGRSNPKGQTQLRSTDFRLRDHHHGKARVRVLRVRADGTRHEAHEYTVATRLFSQAYADVFTRESNDRLVATDTQKNTVYVVAKRTAATTPEDFGVDLATHLLSEYPVLSAVEVDVTEQLWHRVVTGGSEHDHGFVRNSPERSVAHVRLTRDSPHEPLVVSKIEGLTVLKTTQSGFSNFLHDKYTLLPDTSERCMATEMSVEWRYQDGGGASSAPVKVDYAATRSTLREQLLRGFFGPPKGGVFSASLQATIYDLGCLVLSALPAVASISIDTPNIHMIPFTQLKNLTSESFADDVYVATSEPAGTIHCTVSR